MNMFMIDIIKEQKYNSNMERKYKEPTVRDIREFLSESGYCVNTIYNDRNYEDSTHRRRRFKICMDIEFHVMEELRYFLEGEFQAHHFAVGEYFRKPRPGFGLFTSGGHLQTPRRYTVVHCILDKGLYAELFPEKKKVSFTIDEIAELAGIDPEQVRIVK